MTNLQAFEIRWLPERVAEVLARVQAVRLPKVVPGAGWSLGCDADFLEFFRNYWFDAYDWRAAEAGLNAWPQFKARIDGLDIHFVHVVGEAAGKRPLLLTHGWPGSHFEFFHLIEHLAYPSRHGGQASDAFDLIIPSLPGYGYSDSAEGPVGPRHVAGLWNRLMTEVLGYSSYLAQGGDWGAIVTSWLGADHADAVRAIHLNLLPFLPHRFETDEEKAFAANAMRANGEYSSYFALQMHRPQSLALATADNPLGIAAWILERFHDWSDPKLGPIEDLFGLDALITNIMIYVMSESFATSLWLYNGMMREGPELFVKTRVDAPTAYAAFPHDALRSVPPQSLARQSYNLTRWTNFEQGGHFASMEQPAAFLADLREWGREAW